MDTTAHLAAVDLLRARPFPAQRRGSTSLESGPGFHVAVLRTGEGRGDEDAARIREGDEEFEAELQVLIRVLTRRWGEPEVLDLLGHLERSAMGLPVPPPLDILCGVMGEVHGWRVDGRWVGVGVGRLEREYPIRLLAATGEASAVR